MPAIAADSAFSEQKLAKDGPTTDERRRVRRKRMLKTAYATYNNAGCSVPVIVRDLSDTGARITVESMAVLPQRFSLHVELDGFQVECECLWRRQKSYGLRFCGPREATRIMRHQVLTPTSDRFRATGYEADTPTLPVRENPVPANEAGHHEIQVESPNVGPRRQAAFGRLRMTDTNQ